MDILSELAQWRASGTLMELGGHRIFVREAGQGPPLLCLHGFPTASFDFARLLPLLLHYRLITLDFLGFGFSDKPRPYTYSLFEQAMLAEGGQLDDPAGFVKRINDLMLALSAGK